MPRKKKTETGSPVAVILGAVIGVTVGIIAALLYGGVILAVSAVIGILGALCAVGYLATQGSK